MKNREKLNEYRKETIKVFSNLGKDQNFITEFLKDILTPAEFDDISLRWQVVKKLSKGETHREVANELKLGVGTVNRGARELRNKKGGFTLMLKKLGK